jgi:tRNA (guanine-N7-)-methyltransferase
VVTVDDLLPAVLTYARMTGVTASPEQPAQWEARHSFKRRGSRITSGQADARTRLWASYGGVVDGRPLDLPAWFGRTAPVLLEIGFGMGEATAEQAAAEPDRDLLAVDVHQPGQGALLRKVERLGLTNVRVLDGDGVVVLEDMLAPGSLAGIRLYFPDPWPKHRHWKRRLVTTGFLDLAAVPLAPGGVLHVATDWPHYAGQVRALLAAHPAYDVIAHPPWRPPTRFERQGLAAGRPSVDVAAVRTDTG